VRQRSLRRSLHLESLEERSLLATYTWTGATNTNWNTDTNWLGNVKPVAGAGPDTLVFATANLTGAANYTSNNDIAGLTQAFNIQITDTDTAAGKDFSLTGTAVNLGSGGLTNSTAGTTTIANLNVAAPATITSATGTLTISTALALGSNALTIDNAGAVTLSAVITGSGDLTKNNTGGLTISGNNAAYTGNVILNRGTTQISNANALGTAAGSTTLNFNSADNGGNGTVLQLNTITVAAEPLKMVSNSVGNSHRVTLLGSGAANGWGGPITVEGTDLNQFVQSGTGTFTISGSISAGPAGFTGTTFFRGAGAGLGNVTGVFNMPAGSFNRTDSSVWQISSTGNNWATTSIATGELRMGIANALPATAPVSMGQTGGNTPTLNLSGFSQTIAGLTNASTASGTLTITSAAAATLTIDMPTSTSFALAGTSAPLISGAVALVKTGAGTLTLGGANTYSGNTSINGGTLKLAAAAVIPDGAGKGNLAIGAAGTLDVNGFAETVNGLSGAGTVDNTSATAVTFTVGGNNGGGAFDGVIKNSGGGALALTKTGTGTLTLGGANAYTGATTVDGGLTVNGSITSNVTLNAAATLQGSGTITGSLTSAGTVSPGSGATTGILTINGDFATTAGSVNFDISAPYLTAGSNYDKLVVNGQVNLSNSNVTFGNPAPGVPTGSENLILIANDQSDPIAFPLTPAPGLVTIGGNSYLLNYSGDTGNDLTLAAQTPGPTKVYVDDDWGSLSNGQAITDADPVAAGNQAATFGVNAFASVNAGIAAIAGGGASTILTVNAGNYPEAVVITKPITVNLQQSDITFASLDDTTTQATLNLNGITLTSGSNNTSTSFDSVIAGTGGLTKEGTGALTLGGLNTYDGLTTINRGRIVVKTNTSLGSTVGGTIVNGNDGTTAALLELNATTNLTVAENITLNGTAAGRVTLLQSAGTNTLTGNLVTNSSTNPVQLTSSGGAIIISGDISGTITNTSLVIRGGSTGANAITGNVNLNGGIAKTDDGTWILGAAGKTYNWTSIRFARGVVKAGLANVLNPNQLLVMGENGNANAGTFDLNGFAQTVNGIDVDTGSTAVANQIVTNSSATVVTLTINTTADALYEGKITGALNVLKTGTAKQTLSGASTYTGTTTIAQGTLASGIDNALPIATALTIGSGTTVGTLDLGNFNQSVTTLAISGNSTGVNNVMIGDNKTLTVTGTGTSFSVGLTGLGNTTNAVFSGPGTLNINNTAATVDIGISNTDQNSTPNVASLDLTGLGAFIANVATFRVGQNSRIQSTFLMSDTSNIITATTVTIGDSTTNNASPVLVVFGAGTNTITADTINIGLGKANTTVRFASQAANSPGSLTIGGKAAAITNFVIGSNNGTGTAAIATGVLDLRGHVANITAGTITMGVANQTGAGGATGTLSFDAGALTVTTLNMAPKTAAGTGAATATLNIGGGSFTVNTGGSFKLASQATAGTAVGTVNLTGGTLTTNVDIVDGGGAATTTFTINGGTLNLLNHNLGTATLIDTINLQSGGISNILQLNNGAAFNKTTAGVLAIGGTNAYTGATTIAAGTLLVNGTITSTVTNNGFVGGSGTINGNVSGPGGVLPGADNVVGLLTINGNLQAGGAITFDINAPFATPGVDYDRLVVNGTVDLAGATIGGAQMLTGALAPNTALTVLQNDNADPHTLPAAPANGTDLDFGGSRFKVQYNADTGNDIVFVSQLIPATPRTINADATAVAGNDIVVKRVGSNLVVTVDGTTVLNASLAVVSDLTINGQTGNDTLTIDYASGGTFGLPIVFAAGAETGDALKIVGGSFDTITYNYTSAADGNVQLDPDGAGPAAPFVVTYTGVDLLNSTAAGANQVFNLPGTADGASLVDPGTLGRLRLQADTTTFFTTDFAKPTTSLTINGGGGVDNLKVNSLQGDFTLTAAGGAGNDSINILNLAGTGSLIVDGGDNADTITVTSLAVDGNLTVRGGAGDDAITLASIPGGGAILVDGEADNDSLNILSNLAPSGSATFTGETIYNLASITPAAGGAVAFNGATILPVAVTIDTSAGTGSNIAFNGTLQSFTGAPSNLTLNAGTGGNVSFNGAVGLAGSTNLVGQYVIEAENFTSRDNFPGTPPDSWLVVPDESASTGTLTNVRGKFVQSLPDGTGGGGGPMLAPSISYAMNIVTPGVYRLYVRWDGNSLAAGNSDSMFVDVVELKDNTGGTIPDWYELQHTVDGNFDTIPWDNSGGFETDAAGITATPMQFTITTPGTYTVRFSQREDGAAVDAFAFQLASIAAPTGFGPAETGPQGASVNMPLGRLGTVTIVNANNLTAGSTFESGTYQQTNLQGTATFGGNVTITGDVNIDIGNTIVNGNFSASTGGRVGYTAVGAPAVASLTVNGGSASIGSGANLLLIGRRITTTANTSNPTLGTVDFRNATNVNINVASLLLGYNTAGAFNTGNGDQTRGSLLLSLNGNNTITATAAVATSPATTGIVIGDSASPGNTTVMAPGDEATNGNRIVLGNAGNTINANTITIGGRKSSGLIRFDNTGGVLNLNSATGGAANVFIADNNIDTGTASISRLDGTGGTINTQIGQLVVGRRTGATTSNISTGTFTLANGSVNAASLTMGAGAAGAAGIVNVNGGTLAVTGLVTNGPGPGTINQNGGTLKFVTLTKAAGALAYNFNAGTVQNNPGQNLDVTNATINLGSGAARTFFVDLGQTATIQTAALLSGTSLTKSGSGTLVLPGANTYTGGTTISQGTLRIENTSGSATGSGDVTVSAGGTLMGEGTVGGNVILNGNGQLTGNAQLIPGLADDDIGTLNILGNLTFNNAYTQVEVNGGGNDLANVSGQVNITGASIAEPDLINGYVPGPGAPTIVVLTSGSGITGAFAGTVNPTGPAINFDGTNALIKYNGGDGNDLSVTFVFNNPPVARNDSFTVNEDTALSGNVVTNTNPNGADSDPDGDALSGVTLVGAAPAGTFSLQPTGAFTYTPPGNFSGSASFQYTVKDPSNAVSNVATVTINITAVADQPNLTVTNASGNEDTNIPLTITSSLVDTDGSETLQIRISNVPTGATLSAGTNAGGGVWNLTQAQLAGLTIRPAANSDADFTLTVTAISTDTGGVTAQRQANLNVVVNQVADAPTLTVTPASGAEDTSILLPINAALVDTDGSETLTVRISGVPTGVLLSAGANAGSGNWDLTAAQLANLRLTPVSNSDADFTLTVTATSTEAAGGTAQAQATLPVTVIAAADAPVLTIANPNISGLQGVSIPLGIQLADLVDKDGSESLAVTVTLPPGSPATIIGGTDADSDGTWDIPLANVTTAAIRQVPSGSFSITVRATSTESAADANPKTATTSANINVTIINAPPQVTLEDVLVNGDSLGLVSPVPVLAGLPFSFVFSVAEPATYSINWGDGTAPQTGSVGANADETITHTLTKTGTFQPILTVTDLEGGVTIFGAGNLPTVVTKTFFEIGGVIYVGGSGAADRMIFQSGATGINLRLNNQLIALGSAGEKIVAFGNGGNDNISVAASLSIPVEFHGGDGDDYLAGGSLGDTLDGGAGKDRLLGGGGDDTLLGGAGNDNLSGGVGNDRLYGDGVIDEFGEVADSDTPGVDIISGDTGDDYAQGGGGNDTVNGGVGNDFLRGGAGSDRMDGGDGDDLLVGEAGADTMYGRNGSDLLIGGLLSDQLYGGAGGDLIFGGDLTSADDDTLLALWATFGSDPDAALNELESNAVNDNLTDILHGEGDGDWYLYYMNDTFKLATEKKFPNVLRLTE
jgi:autotransporter-associated beta strand protein